MIEWFGPIIIEYYGATEANGFTFCDSRGVARPPGHRRQVRSSATLLILDDDGNEVPHGHARHGVVRRRHELRRTATTRPRRPRAATPSGNASTVGDVGYVDDDGYLYLTDRKTYMIISGGVNIYPQETENLLDHPPQGARRGGDRRAQRGPRRGGQGGRPARWTASSRGPSSSASCIAFCREHLAHFKCPRTIDFEDELPRLPTGKLYKRLLRDRYWGNTTSRIV